MNTKKQEIIINDIIINIVFKKIKNIHLSVYPPDGMVRVSAPFRISVDTIRVFVISRLGWIRRQRRKFEEQERQPAREYISRESHYFLGNRHLLNVIENGGRQCAVLRNKEYIDLYIRKGASILQKQAVMTEWYREQLKQIVPELIEKCQKITGVTANDWQVKRMKTRWGTCNIKAKRIWLNLELAKKNINCIEYIIVHELVHLLERRHNDKFKAYMDKFMPNWKQYKEELNKSPLRDENWSY